MHSNDDRSAASTAHEQLIQMLSAILLQLNTLQTMVRNETMPPMPPMPPMPLDLNTLYNGLNAIEQLARTAIHEIRSAGDDDQPLAELMGVTLAEALSRVIEETAESLGFQAGWLSPVKSAPCPAIPSASCIASPRKRSTRYTCMAMYANCALPLATDVTKFR